MASSQADVTAAQEFLIYLKELDGPDAKNIRLLTQMVEDQLEHAASISEALKDYILKAAPERKLLGLYVLDSISKNVAGPFTQHLGRGLLDAYWLAYERISDKARKQLVHLLASWENPGPGVSTRVPVFPVEVTRPIRSRVNAALASMARVEARQQPPHSQTPPFPQGSHGQHYAAQVGEAPWRYPTPPQSQLQSNPRPYGNAPPNFQHFAPSPTMVPPARQTYESLGPRPVQIPSTQHKVMSDLRQLITNLQQRTSMFPGDTVAQTRLGEVCQLQAAVVQNPNLDPSMWTAIKQQVDTLMSDYAPAANLQNTASVYPAPQQVPNAPTPQPLPHHFQPPPPLAPPAAPQIPNTELLAQLAAKLGTSRNAHTPVPAEQPQSRPMPLELGVSHSSVANSSGSLATQAPRHWQPDAGFLAQLSKLTGNATASTAPVGKSGQDVSAAGLSGLSALLGHRVDSVELSQTSIRHPRPGLLTSLWANQSQCKTCGRRFAATGAGKERKQRHMDYHFRTRMRMADTKQSLIATRSWYFTEMDWIRFREVDNAEAAHDLGRDGSKGAGTADSDQKEQDTTPYVHVPADTSKVNKACPICQENFENSWHAGAQEWVWMDCTKGADGRFFHSSCQEEVMKDNAAARERESRAQERAARERETKQRLEQETVKVETKAEPVVAAAQTANGQPSPSKSPESVLGKRKAATDEDEDDYEPSEHERRVSPRIDAQG